MTSGDWRLRSSGSGVDREEVLTDTRTRRSVLVGKGDDVTLFCEIQDQNQCRSTNWSSYTQNGVSVLIRGGQREEGVSPSVRLLQNCSLLLHNATEEQAGLYTCRHHKGIQEQETVTLLSVLFMSQRKEEDRVTFNCSVTSYLHEVKWLNNDQEVTDDHKELQMSHSRCWTSVSFTDETFPSQFYQTLKCEVRDGYSRQIVTLLPQSPGLTTAPPRDRDGPSEETPTLGTPAGLFLRHVLLSVGLSVLILSVISVQLCAKVKGRGRSKRSRYNRNRWSSVVYENTKEPSVSIRSCPQYEN